MASSSTFYDRYRPLCNQRAVSSKKAAIAIGLAPSIPTRWKNGSLPNGETLIKLSKYFDVSTDALLGLKPLEDELALLKRQRRIAEIEATLQGHDKLRAELDELKSKTHKEDDK